jgi:hypothetical protein
VALVSDVDLESLTSTLIRLQRRISEWIVDTDDETDQARRFPPPWVTDAITKIAKAVTAIAQLDTDRTRVRLQALPKGQQVLSDAEYEAGMVKLRDEAMRQMSTSELAMEIDRRSRMES